MIHYHGTPISGGVWDQLALARRHACVSWTSSDCLPLVAEVAQSFCLDNGAFSAWTRGEQLDIDGFIGWVNAWKKHPGFDWALIPDVIDGDEKENDAMLRLVECSPSWVPVWHMHESLDRLVRLSHEWSRVALGSSGDYAVIGNDRWWGRMSQAMDVVCDDGLPRAKLHGLRMLDPTIFSLIPFASADSTNVARNAGIDGRWKGPYAPASRATRAALMMERIEQHASASSWTGHGSAKNYDLFG